MLAVVIIVAVIVLIGLVTLANSVRVLREYERGIVFRLGRLVEPRGPGVVLLVPLFDRMVRISLRTITLSVPAQEVITKDNVPARVTAVAYYNVIDPSKAVNEIENFHSATLQIAQTSLRSVLGNVDLDTLLSERENLNEALQRVIDSQTEPWGIKVTIVEIKDVEIPERMQHAIARQAEAERERRAKVINAEGEFQAAAKLDEAAEVIGRNSVTLQLRYLQTLGEIGGQQNSTIVFPMPIDLVTPLLGPAAGRQAAPDGSAEARPTAATPGGAKPSLDGAAAHPQGQLPKDTPSEAVPAADGDAAPALSNDAAPAGSDTPSPSGSPALKPGSSAGASD